LSRRLTLGRTTGPPKRYAILVKAKWGPTKIAAVGKELVRVKFVIAKVLVKSAVQITGS
jgi:hypothetical protein